MNIDKEMYGVIDRKGNWVLEPSLEEITTFNKNGIAEACKDGKWGLIDSDGNWVILPSFDQISYYENFNMLAAKSGGKWGVIDLDGKWILKPLYAGVAVTEESGIFEVQEKENGKWGLMRPDSSWILPPCFNTSLGFSEGLAFVEAGEAGERELWGLVDTEGNWIMEPQFDDIRQFDKGLAKVSRNKKWGIIDKKGIWFVRPEMDRIVISDSETTEGCPESIWISKEGKEGMMDGRGNWIIPTEYNWLDYIFHEGLLLGNKKTGETSKAGFFDREGNVVIDFQFEAANYFNGGLAPAKLGGKYGYINQEGKFVIGPRFVDAEPFKGNFAVVQTEDGGRLIDRMGDLVLECDFESGIQWNYPDFTHAIIDNGKSFLLIDTEGNVLLNKCYDSHWLEDEEQVIWVKKDGKWGLLDFDGNEIMPCILTGKGWFDNGVASVCVKR